MMEINVVGKAIIKCNTFEEFSLALKANASQHASLKFMQKSGLTRVIFITFTAGGQIKDTYTNEPKTEQELWALCTP